MKFVTDYARHDLFYRQKRAAGATGWHSADEMASMLADVESILLRHVDLAGVRALELGCGAGEISVWLASRGADVVGVDIAPAAVEWARDCASERGVEVEFRVADVLDLPFESESFDLVVDGACFHCIIGSDRTTFLLEAHRVLRLGGLLYVDSSCWEGDEFPESVAAHLDAESRCVVHGGVAARYWARPHEILDEIRAAGFNLVDHRLKGPTATWPLQELLVVASR